MGTPLKAPDFQKGGGGGGGGGGVGREKRFRLLSEISFNSSEVYKPLKFIIITFAT